MIKTRLSNRNSRAGLFFAALVALGANAHAADKPAALREVFKDHFLIGAAVNRGTVTGAAFRRSAQQTAKDVALVKERFNQISPENDLTWQIVHPR